MVPQDPGRLLGEGLFQVLRRTPSCLSAVQDLLRWTSGRTEDGDGDGDGRRRRLLQVRMGPGPGSFQNHRPALGSFFKSFSDSVLGAGRPRRGADLPEVKGQRPSLRAAVFG